MPKIRAKYIRGCAAQSVRRRLKLHGVGPDLTPEELFDELCPYDFGGSTFIHHLDSLCQATKKRILAIIYMRESSSKQARSQNLRRRHLALRHQLHKRNIPIRGQYTEIACGRYLDERPQLLRAIETARRLQRENPDALAIVITDTRNRFIRGANYDGKAINEEPSQPQYDQLHSLAKHVPLVTLLKPDAPHYEVRTHETEIGMGDRPLGRPKKAEEKETYPGYKKEQREKLRAIAIELKHCGLSYRAIEQKLEIPRSTIHNWVSDLAAS